MTSESADLFFGGNRPSGLPDDAPLPDWDALVNRASTLDANIHPWGSVRSILASNHRRLGADSTLISAIEAIDHNSVYVIAGQQAGLFGGPLYTLYKAMHAVRLAERLRIATGRNVLPLFWVASDDHDFAEANHLGLRTKDGSKYTVAYSPKDYIEGMPVGDIVLDDSVGYAIAHITEQLVPGDRAEQYSGLLRDCWRPGVRWTEAFTRQMLQMFKGTGLMLFDPRWEGAKELFNSVIGREIAAPEVSAALVNDAADPVEFKSRHKQVIHRQKEATNLFFESGGIRYLLRFDGSRFKAGEQTFSQEVMVALHAAEPERFSPAAALRPVCQDAVFPAVATIAGPGERRYLSQIMPLNSHFGVNGSTIWPRASFTIIDTRVARTAEKDGISLQQLFDDPVRLKSRHAAESLPKSLTDELQSLTDAVESRFVGMGREFASLDKSLAGALENEKKRMLRIVDGIRARAIKARKAALEVSGRRISSAAHTLYPNSGPQERWFGYDAIAPFIGTEEFAGLIELTSPGEDKHTMIKLG